MTQTIQLKPNKTVSSYSINEFEDRTEYFINGDKVTQEIFDSYFDVIEIPNHYLALVIQDGEGCDYTIACGRDWFEFNAMNFAEAIKYLTHYIVGDLDDGYWDGNYMGEETLRSVKLIEVKEMWDVPIAHIYKEAFERQNKLEEQAAVEKERAEYERLKKKFGEGK